MKLRILALLIFMASYFNFQPMAYAEEISTKAEEIEVVKNGKLNYNELNKRLQQVEKNVKEGNLSSTLISEYLDGLSRTINAINNYKASTEKELQFVEKKIEALGAAPEDGEKEVREIAQKRTEFNAEAAALKARLSEADILLTQIDELDLMIIQVRNQALVSRLLEKQESLILPQNFYTANKLLATMLFDIVSAVFSLCHQKFCTVCGKSTVQLDCHSGEDGASHGCCRYQHAGRIDLLQHIGDHLA